MKSDSITKRFIKVIKSQSYLIENEIEIISKLLE